MGCTRRVSASPLARAASRLPHVAALALLSLALVASADARPVGGSLSELAGRHQARFSGKFDPDRDGLPNRYERHRSHTNPHKRDTDGDGYSDGFEVNVLHTNPRDAGSPGIVTKEPSGSPSSSGDRAPAGPSSPPASGPSSPPLQASPPPPPEEPPPPPPEEPLPPVEEPPAQVDGEVSTAADLLATAKSAAADGKTYYMRGGNYGDVNLTNVRRGSLVTFYAYPGEQPTFETLSFGHSQHFRFDGFRASTIDIQPGNASTPNRDLQFADCTLGGTQANRINPLAVVGILGYTEDVLIDHCNIGWTDMDGIEDNGNGIRAVNGEEGEIARLTIRRSRIHHVSCDAIQVAGASDFTLDRTEIAYVAPQPGYGCHADSLQNLSLIGDGARITNNYIHHIGYYDESSQPTAADPAGQLIYANNSGGALIENNLFVDSRNYALNLGSGCGGCPPSLRNVILRRNTVVRDGTAFGGESTPDLRWAPTAGSGNRFENNVIGGIAADGSLASSIVTFTGNVYTDQSPIGAGDVGPTKLSFDSSMNCTSPACANAGYRKPSDVAW
jgi:hypothetical protein